MLVLYTSERLMYRGQNNRPITTFGQSELDTMNVDVGSHSGLCLLLYLEGDVSAGVF